MKERNLSLLGALMPSRDCRPVEDVVDAPAQTSPLESMNDTWRLCPAERIPSTSPSNNEVEVARQIRSHDFWRYINLYVCMYRVGQKRKFLYCDRYFKG